MRNAAISACVLMLAACSQSPDSSADVAATEPEANAAEIQGENGQDSSVELPEQTAYDGPIPMPIRVGTDGPDMDACGTYAEVANLDPDGDNYVSVRDAPSTSVKERDRLDAGQGVQVCATSNGWSGIVYAGEDDEEQDCGTGSPVATVRNYTGPCRQGWVDSRYLEMVAG